MQKMPAKYIHDCAVGQMKSLELKTCTFHLRVCGMETSCLNGDSPFLCTCAVLLNANRAGSTRQANMARCPRQV